MDTPPDATSGAPLGSGIAARRQQSSLPAFQLPTNPRSFSTLGSVLTPPPLTAGDGSNPLSSSITNSNSNAVAGYASPMNYWPHTSHTSSYSYGTHASSSPSYTSAQSLGQSGSCVLRNMFTPGGSGTGNRNSRPASPTVSSLGTSTYEPSASYASSLPINAHSQPVSLGGLPSIGQGNIHQQYAAPYSVTNAPPQSQMNTHPQAPQDPYSSHSPLPPPTPSHGYYQPSSGYSPTGHGLSASTQSTSINRPLIPSGPTNAPPFPHHPPVQPAPPLGHLQRYSQALPHMNTMTSPYGQPLLGLHHGALQQQERPFKCDQCPQSFNRNHDLKRHKRIHLAVKPFPCDNCDKSFSRKDALKRHRLVKGCGKADKDGASSQPSTSTKQSLGSSTTPAIDSPSAHIGSRGSRALNGSPARGPMSMGDRQ